MLTSAPHYLRKFSRYIFGLANASRITRTQPIIRGIWGFLIALSLFSVVLEVWSRDKAFQAQLDASRIAAENILQAAAEHADSTLNSISWDLDAVAKRIKTGELGETSERPPGRLLEPLVQRPRSPLLDVLVFARDGKCVAAAVSCTGSNANELTRANFEHHRSHADQKMHVGTPIADSARERRIITVSRRLNDANGAFAGFVLATIPVQHFDRYYDRFLIGQHGTILLATSDGTVLTRRPNGADIRGSASVAAPLFDYMHRHGGNRGSAVLSGQQEQVARLYNYQRSMTYPLVTAVAFDQDEILASWWRITIEESVAIAAMLACVYGLSLWLIAQLRERERLEAALRETHATLEVRNAALDRLANTDGLTGLYNRRFFDQRLAQETARATREQTVLSLIMIDVDHFKRFNDTYGHAAGDGCLRMVAQIIGGAVHRPADVAARFGGEEFAVLLPNTDTSGALGIAEAIRSAVYTRQMGHQGSDLQVVTISAGVASIAPVGGGDTNALIEAADACLYAAKNAGRNSVHPE